MAARVPPRKHLLLSPRSWPCSVQSAQLLPPPPGLAQHFAQQMPPIARTLWACSSVLVASLKRTLPRNMRPPPTLCLISRFKQAFFCLWSTIFRGTCNFSSSFASCSYQRRFESLPRELHRTSSHFEIECCALDKEAV